jgi:uncharacterized protein YPO0396
VIAAGQHRLQLIQLVNWGTFNGSFVQPVPREGLLVTGPSGSGKSSLLDALGAVLVQPKWLSFNAAAQEGGTSDRNRSLVSYVRGAYKREADDATGEVATACLRTETTWSGIALTFDDGAGTRTGLVRLMHLPRGTNASDSLHSLFILADEDVDLLGLSPFVENGLNARQLKAAHPSWWAAPEYSKFASKLQRRLGLASAQAQRLLHKTQSAKNLSSLDTLLRDFMLDEPNTFSLADQSVAQFQELSQAHASVVDARRQVDVLRPLRAIDATLTEVKRRIAALEEEDAHLHSVVLERLVAGATGRSEAVRGRLSSLESERERADHAVTAQEAIRDRARAALDGLGGHELTRLEERLGQVQPTLVRCAERRATFASHCDELRLELPQHPDAFGAFRAAAEGARAGLQESVADRRQRFGFIERAARAGRRVEEISSQLDALKEQRSNLDVRLLSLREALAASTGVSRERLPFGGELLDVLPEEARWQGAIERVLRPLARTLLVPDDLYPRVAEFVDENHLGARLVYARVLPSAGERRPVEDPRSLVHKVVVAESEFAEWITDELHQRFDYPAVGSVAELRAVTRGVTLAGQVKHSATRHEKDDRSRIEDRTQWVLGTSIHVKQKALAEALEAAKTGQLAAEGERDEAESARSDRNRRAGLVDQLLALAWDEIDVDGAQRQVDECREAMRVLRAANTGLDEARRQSVAASEALKDARGTRDRLLSDCVKATDELTRVLADLERWQEELGRATRPPDDVRSALVRRIETLGTAADREETETRRAIADDRRSADAKTNEESRRALLIMQHYKRDWQIPAQDWGIQIDYLPDFLGRLDAVEADRLPEFEERFFALLQTQSQKNIGQLSNVLRTARREVRERVDPINASLRLTEYASGRHLHVRVDDRRLPEVTDFLEALTEIVTGTLADVMGPERDEEAQQQAEERFVRMQLLLTRLASSDPGDQRWRQLCLDTRQHVKFIAEVRDDAGRAVDYFTGAGGLSGGERQKLVIFCLAAALRYQLARDGAETPSYGLVVPDEAFDKTDPAFTKAGLEVFRQFGFQLLLATPLKMLQTLEDYVGGAVVVLNETGKGSRLEYLAFGEADAETPSEPTDAGPQEALL